MMVVKIEVWPGGCEGAGFEIARLGIANRTGLAPVSDYDVIALTSRDKRERVLQHKVYDHPRADGWQPLVQRAISGLKGAAVILAPPDELTILLRGVNSR